MRHLLLLFIVILSSACADIGYYWHSAKGHLSIMNKRVDIDDKINDPEIDNELKLRLQRVQLIRQFSIHRLNLPDNGSYTSYAQLDHPYALQNLFAAPEFSTRLHSWCYPVIGCASYRGYYDAARLNSYIDELRARKFDVYAGRVAAYSTLGWFDDPVLSSFIDWQEYRLAGLVFHELTHQQIYIDDDTRFNESLASAVQQVGTELWLKSNHQLPELAQYHGWLLYREDVVQLVENTRNQLGSLYAKELAASSKRAQKQQLLDAMRSEHTRIANKHSITGGYTDWFSADLNNAKLASVSTYQAHTRAFIRMIEAFKYEFQAFFGYVTGLGDLEKPQREKCLELWRVSIAHDSDLCV